jgi:hypothetical protein
MATFFFSPSHGIHNMNSSHEYNWLNGERKEMLGLMSNFHLTPQELRGQRTRFRLWKDLMKRWIDIHTYEMEMHHGMIIHELATVLQVDSASRSENPPTISRVETIRNRYNQLKEEYMRQLFFI